MVATPTACWRADWRLNAREGGGGRLTRDEVHDIIAAGRAAAARPAHSDIAGDSGQRVKPLTGMPTNRMVRTDWLYNYVLEVNHAALAGASWGTSRLASHVFRSAAARALLM